MKVYPALTSDTPIWFREEKSEAQLQVDLYSSLIKDGFSVRAGVRVLNSTFDLVVFKKTKAIAIIELKTELSLKTRHSKTNLLATDYQILKYQGFGVPVILFWSMEKYSELKVFLNTQKTPEENKSAPAVSHNFKRLYSLLDKASMCAFDCGLSEIEKDLEQKRDEVKRKIA